ncbi:hypothetical protein [Halosimplex salinum]|uniref:hypothetical protein n=1 Tax=Halosimplex salinum TaxID=1710538 RepID=UPI000F4AC522|nr:hypothetical protein [Halosimplex salinum]
MQDTIDDTIDRAAMALGGALILMGVVVLGIVEMLAGEPYGAAPLTNDAGEVIATPLIDPNIRTGLVIAGLVVLLVWQLYRMAATPATEHTDRRVDTAAD